MANTNNEFLSKAAEYAGSEALAKKLIDNINKELDEFDRVNVNDLRKSMLRIYDIINTAAIEIDDIKNRESFIGIMSLNVIEQSISVLFQSAAEIAVTTKMPQSLFVFKAAEMFERVVQASAMKAVSNSIIDMILKNKPMPSKENLS
jgi:hypothetical protein